jgi:serine/threonine protein phosphatase PrpC
MVEDEEIEFIIANGDNLVASARDLISEANRAGGKDNITVVLAKFSRNTESKDDKDLPVDTVKIEPGEMWSEDNIESTSKYSIPPDEDDKKFTK